MAYINTKSKYLHRFLLFPLYSFLVFRFLMVPGFHALHCSVVVCAEAKGNLTFKDELPTIHLSIPWPKRVALHGSATHQDYLAMECEGDAKCSCINAAIFKHDSSWATAGVGRKAKNPCNMRPPSTWKPSVKMGVYKSPGNGTFAKFDTVEDGITACVELYKRNYKDMPPQKLVSLWTAGGGNKHYRSAVSSCYL